MERSDPVQQAAARRRVELDQRIEELHSRNAELTAILVQRPAGQGRAGSSQDQVARADELARIANRRAIEATRRAAAMYLNSATAHERAARMHTLLADNGAGDADQHRHRAQEHLQLASQDRTTAQAMTGGRPAARTGAARPGAGGPWAGEDQEPAGEDRAGEDRAGEDRPGGGE